MGKSVRSKRQKELRKHKRETVGKETEDRIIRTTLTKMAKAHGRYAREEAEAKAASIEVLKQALQAPGTVDPALVEQAAALNNVVSTNTSAAGQLTEEGRFAHVVPPKPLAAQVISGTAVRTWKAKTPVVEAAATQQAVRRGRTATRK